MKFLLSPDSYKGSLTAIEVANNMEIGIRSVLKDADIIKLPIADGGEGTVEVLVAANQGYIHEANVMGPLYETVRAKFGVFNNNQTAIIEVAESSGLTLVPVHSRNPYKTTSYGLGELITCALDLGCKEIIVGLGGSATNDGGVGMAQALGVKFLDQAGQEIPPGGEGLLNIHTIDVKEIDTRIKDVQFIIASDVTNPLCGEFGATAIFGPQKGATTEMVKYLDQGLENLALKINEQLKLDIRNIEGAGAAGGLGAGLMAFLSANMQKGIDIVFTYTNIENIIKTVDFIITGEGFTDEQTMFGKAPYGVAKMAKKYGKPVICISGGISIEESELFQMGMDVIMGTVQAPMNLEEAMESAGENVQYTTASVIRTLMIR